MTIQDNEYVLKCKIRSNDKLAIDNFTGIIQELFDDMFSSPDTIDLSIKEEIIHRLWNQRLQ